MSNIFFTSDLHIGHKNILEYTRLDFSSVDHMEESLVVRWNSKVTKEDTVYILGDASFAPIERTLFVLSQLKGKKHLLLGNHDKGYEKKYKEAGIFESIKGYDEFWIKHEGKKHYFHLSHFPTQHWSCQAYGSIYLFGHLHGHPHNLSGKCMDVGADTNSLYPYSLDEILEIMESKPVVDPRKKTNCDAFKKEYGIEKSSPIIVFLVGLPYSGKTTFRNKVLKNNSFKIISSDDYICAEAKKLGKDYNTAFNELIFSVFAKVEQEISSLDGSDYIVDMTNLTAKTRRRKLSAVPSWYTKVAIVFDPLLEEVLFRVDKRPEQSVPKSRVIEMANRFEPVTVDEGWDYIYQG